MFGSLFQRPVTQASGFGPGTAVMLGRWLRGAQPVAVDDRYMFFRDVPGANQQRSMTASKALPKGRLFTAEEIAAIEAASLVNKPINDEMLRWAQGLYDDHDPRRMAGAALLGALAGGGLVALTSPPPAPVPQQGEYR